MSKLCTCYYNVCTLQCADRQGLFNENSLHHVVQRASSLLNTRGHKEKFCFNYISLYELRDRQIKKITLHTVGVTGGIIIIPVITFMQGI